VNTGEEEIGTTLTFYRLQAQHHKHPKSANMRERLNEELRRRTRVERIFPNAASCLRLTRALCIETHEGWLEDKRYLNGPSARGTSRKPRLPTGNQRLFPMVFAGAMIIDSTVGALT
jgi:transposase-like protein